MKSRCHIGTHWAEDRGTEGAQSKAGLAEGMGGLWQLSAISTISMLVMHGASMWQNRDCEGTAPGNSHKSQNRMAFQATSQAPSQ